MQQGRPSALIDRLRQAPIVHDRQQAERVLAELAQAAQQAAVLAPLAASLQRAPVRNLLAGIFGASPFLTAVIERDPERLLGALMATPEAHFDALCRTAEEGTVAAPNMADAMRALRHFKTEVALLTALCDLGGVWPVIASL